MQREMRAKGIRREDVHATHAVLYGAAAGYAVSASTLLPFFSGSPPVAVAVADSRLDQLAVVYHLPN